MRELTPNEATANALLTAAWEALANGPDAAAYRPLMDDIAAFQQSLHTEPARTEHNAKACPIHGNCTMGDLPVLAGRSRDDLPLHGSHPGHARPGNGR